MDHVGHSHHNPDQHIHHVHAPGGHDHSSGEHHHHGGHHHHGRKRRHDSNLDHVHYNDGSTSYDDDAIADRWEWGETLQEVQKCVPLCKDNCINVSGASSFNCFVESATWDMPPFRCCPDIHTLEGHDGDCESVSTTFDALVAESWTTSADDTLDVTDLTNKVKHGEYSCTDLADVELPYHGDHWYNRKRRHAVDDGEGGEVPHDHNDDGSVTYEDDRGKHKKHHKQNHDHDHHDHHGHSHGHAHGHTHGNAHGHGHHHHHTHPTHPSTISGQQRVCTLTCENGEVPANGWASSTCQVVSGVSKWVNRITHCVNADDILAVLSQPDEDGNPTAQVAPPNPGGSDGGSDGADKSACKNSRKCAKKKKKANKGDGSTKKQKKLDKQKKKVAKKNKKDKKKKNKALRAMGLDSIA